MRIGILGRGRLGRTLALLLAERGHLVDLRGRGEIPDGEVVLLTVPDPALAETARTIPADRVLLHCSGPNDLDVLGRSSRVGSLHPLMSFPGPEVAVPPLDGVGAAVAGDPEGLAAARAIARDLGMIPFEVPGDRRLYHAAAVIAGNFATVLLAEASRVLMKAGIEAHIASHLLSPLAVRSLTQAAADPSAAITGPAARGDVTTLDAHRAALRAAGLADLLPLYDVLSQHARELVQVRPLGSDDG